MSERDDADELITTVLREEADRLGAGIPPPLEDLQHSATRRRQSRWVAAGLGGFAAALMVGALVWAYLPSAEDTSVAPAGGPITDTFDVPTYAWDEGGGDAAQVSGTLAFTDAGCPLLVEGERATALMLPNATGVTYDNGVRGVVDGKGRVYATEGQTMEYAGGWQQPAAGEFAQSWAALCGDTPARDIVYVNDVAAHETLSEVPPRPADDLPTAPATAQELGWFEVPTFPFDADGPREDALIEGVVEFTDEGCPYVETDGFRTGLVFPNAEGFDNPDVEEPRMVYAYFDSGTSGMMAMEGEAISYGGGGGAADDERWTSVCAQSPVDGIFIVQDTL
ncbi:hypothetical protein [Ornithinimicrobium cryptoxanthini]|uniref:Uncharacterized protein n=1 Tax=Ornithinimicrobium cryptoxanthini TaxID=2934161 RepID=A0ABY4YIL4_9MICO|nr:hypothetical protein [Ornithinimicrobium cryptoxanthini]USQ76612.1 hypothetical protein NF557_01380 [Ornithinimicrobium cryptoxanthini]